MLPILTMGISSCCCCGSDRFKDNKVLWKKLIDDWQLAQYEIDYINQQQGLCCLDCGANIRSIALAASLMKLLGFQGLLKDFIQDDSFHKLQILEINKAGTLTSWLLQLPGHRLIEYPEYDMMSLPFRSSSFDIVIHSDTLEHVEHPIRGLSECRRVLQKGTGYCIFTVPLIVDRLTRTRYGLPPSYHGVESSLQNDHLVFTEYGADAWVQVIKAGFSECRIISHDFPASNVLVGVA